MNKYLLSLNEQLIYQGQIISEKLIYTQQINKSYLRLYNDPNQKQFIDKDLKNNQYVDRMLLSTIFSKIIGSNLPMSIYLNQKVQILQDVPLNKQIQGKVTIHKDLGKNRFLLLTQVLGKDLEGKNIQYVTGQAKILLKT